VSPPATEVLARERELASIHDSLRELALSGGALVLDGAPGIGKTTLWREGLDFADREGWTVLRASCVQSESQLAYTTLGDLLDPVLDAALEDLPDPQRDALQVALLRTEPGVSHPDARAVGLGLMSALRSVADHDALVVAVDDIGWADADSTRALAFALRRLTGTTVALFATTREEEGPAELVSQDLPSDRVRRLRIGTLTDRHITRLLRDRLAHPLPPSIVRRVVDAAGGNPFAALEIGRSLGELDRLPAAGEPLPVPADIADLLRTRLRALDPSTLEVLAIVAARDGSSRSLVEEAVGDREAARDGLARAETEGILVVDRDVRFAHPLHVSAFHALQTWEEHRDAHRRLAEVVVEPEERALHRAWATEEPDEAVAAATEEAADEAEARGAPEAAAVLQAFAVRLTVDEAARTRRRVRAADLNFAAGNMDEARRIVTEVVDESPPGPDRALLLQRLGDFSWGWPNRVAELGRQALEEAGDDDRASLLAVDSLAWAAMMGEGTIEEAAGFARQEVEYAERLQDDVYLAYGYSTYSEAEFLSGRPWRELSDRGVAAQDRVGEFPTFAAPRIMLGWQLTRLGQFEEARLHLDHEADRLRRQGNMAQIPEVLSHLAEIEWRSGNWSLADDLVEEGFDIASAAGEEQAIIYLMPQRAEMRLLRGDLGAARRMADEALAKAVERSRFFERIKSTALLGWLDLTEGDARKAADRFEESLAMIEAKGVLEPGSTAIYPDVFFALTAGGRSEVAAELADRLEARSKEQDLTWTTTTVSLARGLVASSRGEHEEAIARLEEALAGYPTTGQLVSRGLTLLALGSARRAAKQKRSAREAFEDARTLFRELGSPGWVRQAEEELGRIGGPDTSITELTGTERKVAELVAAGRSNREVAEQLFLSVKTVEANLSRIYRKLGISSRRELTPELLTPPDEGTP
jgi:DNA-binding NarL/FixJ family response regulator